MEPPFFNQPISPWIPPSFFNEPCDGPAPFPTIDCSQFPWSAPGATTSSQASGNPLKRKTSPLAEKGITVFRKKSKKSPPPVGHKSVPFQDELSIYKLFSIPNVTNIPLCQSSVTLLENKQNRWKSELVNVCREQTEINYRPSANTEDYINLARSLFNRFLQTHPFMNSEPVLPSLRFTALRTAIKYLDDFATSLNDFQDWLPRGRITLKELSQMEMVFLKALDWTIELR